jgi:hypothetical protein
LGSGLGLEVAAVAADVKVESVPYVEALRSVRGGGRDAYLPRDARHLVGVGVGARARARAGGGVGVRVGGWV